MKPSLLLLAFAALIFTSCTSAYKTGQTPDDVYYSPARPQDEYVQVQKNDDREYHGDSYYEDRYLHMRAQNPYLWSQLDDYYYNSPYAYNYYGSSWNTPYNNYWCWNNYYNPYYGSHVVVINPKSYTPPPSRPIAFNPASYGGGSNSNNRSYINGKTGSSGSYVPTARYNNSNSNSGSLGSSIRKVFSNENSSSNYQPSSSSTPTRSYTPSSSSSSSSTPSSSSSSGSSSSGTSRPGR